MAGLENSIHTQELCSAAVCLRTTSDRLLWMSRRPRVLSSTIADRQAHIDRTDNGNNNGPRPHNSLGAMPPLRRRSHPLPRPRLPRLRHPPPARSEGHPAARPRWRHQPRSRRDLAAAVLVVEVVVQLHKPLAAGHRPRWEYRRRIPRRCRSEPLPAAADNSTKPRRHPTTIRPAHCGFRAAIYPSPRLPGHDTVRPRKRAR
jgi:hypothetical protein